MQRFLLDMFSLMCGRQDACYRKSVLRHLQAKDNAVWLLPLFTLNFVFDKFNAFV